MLRAALGNPALWDGSLEHLAVVRLFASASEAREPSSASKKRIGAVVLGNALHYVAEFIDPENVATGFKVLSEDVLEAVTDVRISQNYNDGVESSWLFELHTFSNTFFFCVYEVVPGKAVEESRSLSTALTSLPCVSVKWDYIGDAISQSANNRTSSSSQPAPAAGPSTSMPTPIPVVVAPEAAKASEVLSPSPARPPIATPPKQAVHVNPIPLGSLESASRPPLPTPQASVERAPVDASLHSSSLSSSLQSLLLDEAETRRAVVEAASDAGMELVVSFLAGTSQLYTAKTRAQEYLQDVKELRTSIDTFDLFDPAHADHKEELAKAGASAFHFFSSETSKDDVFERWVNRDAQNLAEEFEKVARQRCGKYLTKDQHRLVERRKKQEKDIATRQLRETTSRFDQERSDLHEQLDKAAAELKRLNAINRQLQTQLDQSQQRERAVIDRSRKRETELAAYLSPGGGSAGGTPSAGPSSARRSVSLQPDESRPGSDLGRKTSFNFFASTPQS